MTPEGLIGRSVEFVYADETYLIEIVDGETLRWTRTRGESVGTTDIERYVWSAIGDHRSMITWIEASGLGLSSVIDLHTGTLTTHANTDRDVFVNTGAVRQIG
ncbi:MAG: hypothetical protein AAGA37_05775 [Actinomycetota bacterium]